MFGFVGKHISTTDFTNVSIFSWPGHSSGVFAKEDRHRGYHWCQTPEDHSALAGVWLDGWLDCWMDNGLEELVAEAIKKQQRLDKLETEHVKQQAIFTKSWRNIKKTRKPWRYQKSLDSCRFLPSCQTNWQKFFYKKASGIQRQPCELGPLGILNGLSFGTMACWNPGGQHPQQVWLHVRKAQG